MSLQGKKYYRVMLCLLAVFASGCASTSELYRGGSVASEHVVAFEEQGSHEGTWETFDITINYGYIQRGDFLEIKGRVSLGGPYHNVYPRLNFLDAYLFFLDPDSHVLEAAGLVSSINSRTGEDFEFSRSFMVPSGTANLSFGYRGEVCEKKFCVFFHQMPQPPKSKKRFTSLDDWHAYAW